MRLQAAGALAALLISGCASMAQPACDRTCLISAAEGYASHGPTLPAKVKFTENGAAAATSTAWLTGATSINIHGAYASPETHETIVVGTGMGADDKPAVFGLRIRAASGKASEAELIVARNGEASLAPPGIPLQRETLMDEPVPAAQRTAPAVMIAAANAYFDGIEIDSGAKVPVTPDCERVENGVQTTSAARGRCNSLEAFDYITKVRDRRYPVVDVERGIVVGLVAFDIPGGDYKRIVDGKETMREYKPRSLLLMEAFKIVDGKIRHIQATMRNVPLGAPTGWK